LPFLHPESAAGGRSHKGIALFPAGSYAIPLNFESYAFEKRPVLIHQQIKIDRKVVIPHVVTRRVTKHRRGKVV